MSDVETVRGAGINSAIIVDDGYDEIPSPDELRNAEWDNFFDDTLGNLGEPIRAFFPEYDAANRTALRDDQDFISALWNARESLADVIGDLFDEYERKTRNNRRFLERVERVLGDLELEFQCVGRDFVGPAQAADLIIIDLFLGTAQSEADRERTVDGLRRIIEARETPPTIVLMSQVSLLKKAPELRDEVGLHASGFRGVQKKDIEKSARLRGLIVALASHRADSQLLAEFTRKWHKGAKEAVDKAVAELRRIDIDDLHHIQTLLLAGEGVRASSYMVDVLDRVLQFEIEANDPILNASAALDSVSDKPAPLTIAHDKDSFRLIERTIYQNPKRRKHESGAIWPITFGDVLVPNFSEKTSGSNIFKGDPNRVFFVASPECDFIRTENKLKSALLIAGELTPLDMSKPVFADDQSTPILDLGKRGRFQVRWNFKDLDTISLRRAQNLLEKGGPGQIGGTLRDVSALSLRRNFIERLGAIGLLASPPKSFRFSATCHYPAANGELRRLDFGSDNTLAGSMVIEPKGKKADIVFDHAHEDDFIEAILGLDQTTVLAACRGMITKLGEQGYAQQLFRTGFSRLTYPMNGTNSAVLFAPDGRTDKFGNLVKERVGTLIRATTPSPVIEQGLRKQLGLLFYISADPF